MATIQDIIRRITIVGRTEGVTQTKAQLDQLAKSQAAVATTTETTSRATLGLTSRINSLQRSLDVEYRAEQNLVKVTRELDAAVRQGILSQERANALAVMAGEKYKIQGEGAKRAAESMALFKEMSLGFIGGIAGGLAVGGLAELPNAIGDVIEKLGNTGNVARTIGVTTSALQQLRYAARLSDVEVGTLDDALAKFSTNIATAGSPLNRLLELNKVKISGDVLTDLEHFADLVKNATNQEQRNAIVTMAFGKSAQEMGRLFEEGGAGIARWSQEAIAAGAVISDDTIQKAGALNDEMERLKPRIEAAQAEFAVMVMPAEVDLLEKMNMALRDTRGILQDISSGNLTGIFTKLAQFTPVLTGFLTGNGAAALTTQGINEKIATITVHGGATGAPTTPETKPTTSRTLLPSTPDIAAKQRADAINRVTDSLKLQLQMLKDTDRQSYVDQQLSVAKVTAASKEGKAIEALAGKYYDQKEAIDDYSQVALSFTQTLIGDLKQGKSVWESFGGAAMNAIDGIAQKMITTGITNLISNLVTGGFGFGFGGGGGFIPGITGPRLHSGGEVGMGGMQATLPAIAWMGAPRYHTGGIAGLKPDEVPAILQRGERVVPRGGDTGGGVQFNVVINGNADADAVQRLKREIVPLMERHNRHKARRVL